VRFFGRVAGPHVPRALEAHVSHEDQFKHAFRVDPRANATHFVELVKRCILEEQRCDVVIQQRETSHLSSMDHIVMNLHEDKRRGQLVVWVQIDSALVLEPTLGMNVFLLVMQHLVAALCGCPREHIISPHALAGSTPSDVFVIEFCLL